MADFNSDLNKLFKNYQQQQQYTKYLKASSKDKKDASLWKDIDLNNDGKINSKDKSQMTKEATALKKNKNLFDVNGDGKFTQDDIDLFTKGDVNGDGEITKEELNFVAAFKKDMAKEFKNQKADFELDGKKYVKGKLASGVVDGKYYRNGVLADGVANGKKYVKGELANGIYSGYLYQDGVKVFNMSSQIAPVKTRQNIQKTMQKSYDSKKANLERAQKNLEQANEDLNKANQNLAELHKSRNMIIGAISNPKNRENADYADFVKEMKEELAKINKSIAKAKTAVSLAKSKVSTNEKLVATYQKSLDSAKVSLDKANENLKKAENTFYEKQLALVKDGKLDKIYDVNGKPANVEIDGVKYKDGVKFTGSLDDVMYKDGIKFTGSLDGKKYKDGLEVASKKFFEGAGLCTQPYSDKAIDEDSIKYDDQGRIISFQYSGSRGLKEWNITYNDDGSFEVASSYDKEPFEKMGHSEWFYNEKISFDSDGKMKTRYVQDSIQNYREYTQYFNDDGSSYLVSQNSSREETIGYDKDGNVTYSIQDKRGEGLQQVTFDIERFSDSAKIKFAGKVVSPPDTPMQTEPGPVLVINSGDKAEISLDDVVPRIVITRADGSVEIYNEQGEKIEEQAPVITKIPE